MPELPEVEVVCRQLNEVLAGQEITGVKVHLAKAFADPQGLLPELIGARFTEVQRRGKYLLLYTEHLVLVGHLRMTGALLYRTHDASISHVRVEIQLAPPAVLYFKDVRTFGGLTLLRRADLAKYPPLLKLGPEPLSPQTSDLVLYTASRGRKVALKTFLLDQRVIAGVGNIYADEALFLAGLRPQMRADRLTRPKARRLLAALKEVLTQSIEDGGTTFRDYRDSSGKRGLHVKRLAVYGRKGLPCKRCQHPLQSIRLGGRTTVYCPHCQK